MAQRLRWGFAQLPSFRIDGTLRILDLGLITYIKEMIRLFAFGLGFFAGVQF